jgi:hypothetical protein
VLGKERYPGPPAWRWRVGMRFLPLKNSVFTKPWQQGGHSPKSGRNTIEEEVLFIYLLIYLFTMYLMTISMAYA